MKTVRFWMRNWYSLGPCWEFAAISSKLTCQVCKLAQKFGLKDPVLKFNIGHRQLCGSDPDEAEASVHNLDELMPRIVQRAKRAGYYLLVITVHRRQGMTKQKPEDV